MPGLVHLFHSGYIRHIYDQAPEGRMAMTLEADIAWPGGTDGRGFLKCFRREDRIGLCNEVTGYLLAHSCGLPVPTYAAFIKLPEAVRAAYPEYSDWAFAVSRVPGKTATTRYNVEDPAEFSAVADLLCHWNDLPATVAFDDWTANQDRNLQNVLIESSSQIYLIDHSNLPVTLRWQPKDLDPMATFTNILLDIFRYRSSSGFPERTGIALSAAKHSRAYASVEDELTKWWDLLLEGASERREALESFLSVRADGGYRRLSDHLNLLAV